MYGDYIGVTPIGEADTLIIDEDNTYEYKSGRYDNHTQNGKFILSEDYDKGVIKVEFAPSSATQEYIEYEGGNNPFLAEAYFTLDERVTADGRENCVVVKGSGGINRCDTFYRDIN